LIFSATFSSILVFGVSSGLACGSVAADFASTFASTGLSTFFSSVATVGTTSGFFSSVVLVAVELFALFASSSLLAIVLYVTSLTG